MLEANRISCMTAGLLLECISIQSDVLCIHTPVLGSVCPVSRMVFCLNLNVLPKNICFN